LDTTGTHLWLVIWKAYAACQSAAQSSIENLGMCYSDFAVLECLLHKGPLPVNTIGQKVSLTSGSITTAVDRLADRGLVERQDSKTDRRAKIVVLTAEGRKLIKPAFQKHERDMERIADSLTVSERQALLKLAKKFGLAAAAMIR
jgi:MarR family transcriptional regulator, 2-MHQ and catechol-resistance regulon repressor